MALVNGACWPALVSISSFEYWNKNSLCRFTGLGGGLFKHMVSVENTRKGIIAMNEALKNEAEAKANGETRFK